MYKACIHYNGLTEDHCNNGDRCKSGHWCSIELQGTREGFVLGDRKNITRAQAIEYLTKREAEEKQAKEEARRAIEEKIELARTVRENDNSTRANRSDYRGQLDGGDTTIYDLLFRKVGPGEMGRFHPENEHPSIGIIKDAIKERYFRRFCEKTGDHQQNSMADSLVQEDVYGTCGAGSHALYRRNARVVICSRCLIKAYCSNSCMRAHSQVHVWECKLHPGYVQEYDAEYEEAKRQCKALTKALIAKTNKAKQETKEAKDVKDAEIKEKNDQLAEMASDTAALIELLEEVTKMLDAVRHETPEIYALERMDRMAIEAEAENPVLGATDDDEESVNDDNRVTSQSLSAQYRTVGDSKAAGELVTKVLFRAKRSKQAADEHLARRAAEAKRDRSVVVAYEASKLEKVMVAYEASKASTIAPAESEADDQD